MFEGCDLILSLTRKTPTIPFPNICTNVTLVGPGVSSSGVAKYVITRSAFTRKRVYTGLIGMKANQ